MKDLEAIIREYIDKSLHLSLGTTSDGKPWVCEVHFVYDADLNLYFRSLSSRRHSKEIALNPHVAGNIVAQHQAGEVPHGIYFEGTAEMLVQREEREEIFPVFQQRQGVRDSALEESESPDGAKFYKITVSNWYAFGKFDGETVQKYELAWNGG